MAAPDLGGDDRRRIVGMSVRSDSSLRLLCPRDDFADRVLTMLRGAVETLTISDPLDPSTDIGPVIDQEALAALDAYATAMARRPLGERARCAILARD
jgi:delta 1-pyrroline-5-carboxylate dehydrogenase